MKLKSSFDILFNKLELLWQKWKKKKKEKRLHFFD